MSEHQVYEFVAVDRPLTTQEMAKLRAISTRAEITSTRFSNHYNWGDLKADPRKLLARYFDVHVYTADWGQHRFMVRLPADRVDEAALRPYFVGQRDWLTRTGDHLILDLDTASDGSDPDEYAEVDTDELVGLRAGLLHGDMRVPYLAWLFAVQCEDVPDTATEPPVPPGLNPLPGPLAGLADFLRLDDCLLRAAMEASPAERSDPDALRRWIARMSSEEARRWLVRAVERPEQPLGAELVAAFRKTTASAAPGKRTVRELRARADVLAELGERRAQAAAARQIKKVAEARRKRLAALAAAHDRSWAQLEELVAARKYDDAVPLALDLHDVALEKRQPAEFLASMTALKQRQSSCPGFFTRLKRKLAERPEAERLGDLR